MIDILKVLIIISVLGLIFIFIRDNKINRNNLKLTIKIIVLLIVFAVVYLTLFNRKTIAQGAQKVILIILLYLFMVLGMAAHTFYSRLSIPKKKRPLFDWGNFLAPLFISPIIFLSIVAAFDLENLDIENFTITRYMIFFIAFENGFFWKDFFYKRKKDIRGKNDE